jgi:hypothetical protein
MTTTVADTLQARWAARTTPAPGGHLMWQGAHQVRFHGTIHQPARVAFTIRTGRQPVGKVWSDCGVTGCVAPNHVDDQPGRQRTRQQLRAVQGLPPRPPICAHGHGQNTHGRLDERGHAYCNACVRQGAAA